MRGNFDNRGAIGFCIIYFGYDVDIVTLFCIQGERKWRKAVGLVHDAEQAELQRTEWQ
jgi:hypothetical protein